MSAIAFKSQKGAVDLLEPEWQAVVRCLMWALEPELESSARATLSLDLWLRHLSSLPSKSAFFTRTLQLEHVACCMAWRPSAEWLFIDIYWQTQRDQFDCLATYQPHISACNGLVLLCELRLRSRWLLRSAKDVHNLVSFAQQCRRPGIDKMSARKLGKRRKTESTSSISCHPELSTKATLNDWWSFLLHRPLLLKVLAVH